MAKKVDRIFGMKKKKKILKLSDELEIIKKLYCYITNTVPIEEYNISKSAYRKQ